MGSALYSIDVNFTRTAEHQVRLEASGGAGHAFAVARVA